MFSATEVGVKVLKLAPQVKVECLVMISAPQVRELVGTTGSPSTEEGKGGGVAAT